MLGHIVIERSSYVNYETSSLSFLFLLFIYCWLCFILFFISIYKHYCDTVKIRKPLLDAVSTSKLLLLTVVDRSMWHSNILFQFLFGNHLQSNDQTPRSLRKISIVLHKLFIFLFIFLLIELNLFWDSWLMIRTKKNTSKSNIMYVMWIHKF